MSDLGENLGYKSGNIVSLTPNPKPGLNPKKGNYVAHFLTLPTSNRLSRFRHFVDSVNQSNEYI